MISALALFPSSRSSSPCPYRFLVSLPSSFFSYQFISYYKLTCYHFICQFFVIDFLILYLFFFYQVGIRKKRMPTYLAMKKALLLFIHIAVIGTTLFLLVPFSFLLSSASSLSPVFTTFSKCLFYSLLSFRCLFRRSELAAPTLFFHLTMVTLAVFFCPDSPYSFALFYHTLVNQQFFGGFKTFFVI